MCLERNGPDQNKMFFQKGLYWPEAKLQKMGVRGAIAMSVTGNKFIILPRVRRLSMTLSNIIMLLVSFGR